MEEKKGEEEEETRGWNLERVNGKMLYEECEKEARYTWAGFNFTKPSVFNLMCVKKGQNWNSARHTFPFIHGAAPDVILIAIVRATTATASTVAANRCTAIARY